MFGNMTRAQQKTEYSLKINIIYSLSDRFYHADLCSSACFFLMGGTETNTLPALLSCSPSSEQTIFVYTKHYNIISYSYFQMLFMGHLVYNKLV